MGNFKIEIEAVGGHGSLRDTRRGEMLDYNKALEREPDKMAFDFVNQLASSGCSIVSAKLVHWPDTTPIVDDLKTAMRQHGDFKEDSTANGWFLGEEMLKHFRFHHLPEGPMRETSRMFAHLAYMLVRTAPRCAERSAALRKLLEGKDAAVRAVMVD